MRRGKAALTRGFYNQVHRGVSKLVRQLRRLADDIESSEEETSTEQDEYQRWLDAEVDALLANETA